MKQPAQTKRDFSGLIGIGIVMLLLLIVLPLSINALASGDPDFGNPVSLTLDQVSRNDVDSEDEFPVLSFSPEESGDYALYLMCTYGDLKINSKVDQYSKSGSGVAVKDKTVEGVYSYFPSDQEYGYKYNNLSLEAGKTYYFVTSQNSDSSFSSGRLDCLIRLAHDFSNTSKMRLDHDVTTYVYYRSDFPIYSFSPESSGEYAVYLLTSTSDLQINNKVDLYSKKHTSKSIVKDRTLTGEYGFYDFDYNVFGNCGNKYDKLYLEAGKTYYFVTSYDPDHPFYSAVLSGVIEKIRNGPGLTAEDVTATYGDTGLKIKASTTADSPLSYSVKSGKDIISVNSKTGALTIKGAGKAVVTVKAEETDLYCEATTDVTVTIKKVPLTITAKNQSVLVGQAAPKLGKSAYTVSGLINGDTLTKEPTLKYAPTPDTSAPGKVDIIISGAEISTPTGYDVKYVNGTLFINQNQPFTDIQPDAYYFEPVIWAVNHNPQITNGTSATKFSPNATCTRGQVVTFLWRANGCPEPSSTKNPFKDVKSSAYYYKAVLWAVEEGITNGTSKNAFSPNAACTRAHVVTFLWRSAGKPAASQSNPFKDLKTSEYYYKAVLWASNENITTGTSANKFSPNDPCTRGQIVTFLFRYMN